MRIVWDCESHLIKQGMITPRLVCVSYVIDAEERPGLMDRATALTRMNEWLRDPINEYVGHHIQYDFGVLAAENITLLPFIFRAYEEGRIHDTKIRQQLVDIANGDLKFHTAEEGEEESEEGSQIQHILKTQYSLDALAWRLCKIKVPKEGTYRLKYATLDGVPIERWPQEAIDYAINDAVVTRKVFLEQQDRYQARVLANSAKQHQAAWALQLMSAWGVRTDGEAVKALRAKLEEELGIAYSKLAGTGILREGTTQRNMKVIKERIVAGYTAKGKKEEIPLTPKGQVGTAGEVLLASGDPDLKVLADAMKSMKLVNTYVPILESGTRYPINASYNVLLETGRTSCSRPNCFDADTEVLTRQGWVKFPDLDPLIEVAQYHEDGSIDFVVPTAHQKLQHLGKMVHLTNEHIDLLVTPDHRCLIRNRKSMMFQTCTASEYPEDVHQLNAGNYIWGKGLPLSNPELQLLVALQADGSYHDSGLDFTFYKPRKYQRFQQILEDSGVEYSIGDKYDARYNSSGKRFRVQTAPIVEKLKSYLGPDKKFGPWLLEMSRDQAELLERELWHWDGCFTRKSMYSSSIEDNADWVQIVLSLLNIRAKKRLYYQPDTNSKVNYQVDVRRKEYSLTTNVGRTIVDWDGPVYCLSVPSSYIMVRRNRCVMITGQCQNPPRKGGVRECFVPAKDYVYGTTDYDTLELRTLAQATIAMNCKYRFMADALCAGEDLHLSLAADLLGIDRQEAKKRYAEGDKVVEEYRQMAKPASFGFPGGMSSKTFVEYAAGYGVTVTQEKADEIHRTWKKAWPEMVEYFKKVKAMLDDTDNEIPTICHHYSNRYRGDVTFTAASNSFFQGLAADGAKDALWEVTKECLLVKSSPLYGSHPVLFLHDEIILEIPDDLSDPSRASNAIKRQAEIMIKTMKKWVPDIPITATPVLFRRWYKGAKPVFDAVGNLLPSKPVTEGNKVKWVADTLPNAPTVGIPSMSTETVVQVVL